MPNPTATMAIVKAARDALAATNIDPSLIIVSKAGAAILTAEHGGAMPVSVAGVEVVVSASPDAPDCRLLGHADSDDPAYTIGWQRRVNLMLMAEPNPFGGP